MQKSPILNHKIKFRIKSLDLHQQQGIVLLLLICSRLICSYLQDPCPLVIWGSLGCSGPAARCDGVGSRAGNGTRALSRGRTRAGRCLHGAAHSFPSKHHPARLCNGDHTNKSQISSGWDGVPQNTPARAEHPQNHCWECLCLTLFFLSFGPVHRHPWEPASIHEPHPPAQPQEGFQPQRHIPVGAAGAHLCPYTLEG